MPRAVLVHNSTAGRNRRAGFVDEIVGLLRQGDVETEARPTESADEATALTREVARSGEFDRVFTLGGDGSLRAAAQGLLGSEIALAPIPAGTTNVVARALGIPLDSRRAALALARSEPRPCDVGLCTEADGARHVFLMQASAGLDAAVMAGVPSRAKNHLGRLAVGIYGLWIWWRYGYPPIRFRADDGPQESATQLIAANIAHYAGDFRIAPEASFVSRRLDLVTFRGEGRLAALAFATALLRRRHLAMRDATCRPVDSVALESPLVAPFQLDGDALDLEPPLTLRLSRDRVHLLFPLGRKRTQEAF